MSTLGITLAERLLTLGFTRIDGLPTPNGPIEKFEGLSGKGTWSASTVEEGSSTVFFVHTKDGEVLFDIQPTDNEDGIRTLFQILEAATEYERAQPIVADGLFDQCINTPEEEMESGNCWKIDESHLKARTEDPKWNPPTSSRK